MERQAEAAFEHPVLAETTLPAAFEASAARTPERAAQAYKGGVYDRSLVAGGAVPAAPAGEFATLTYERTRGLVRRLTAGFRALGVEADDHVAIAAHTRMEWTLCDLALLSAGAVVTTVYPESTPDRTRYLLADADADGAVVENAAVLERVLSVAEDLPLSFVVVVDTFDPADLAVDVDAVDPSVYTLAEIHERGEAAPTDASQLAARDPGDLASLIYTSGTTGQPTGVRLSHRNFRANVNQVFRRLGPRPGLDGPPVYGPETTQLSVLPLSHVFERLMGQFLPLAAGATVAYAERPGTLRSDLEAVEPTLLTGVPRLYERLADAIREAGGGSRQIRGALGGRMEYLISGGAALATDVADLFDGAGVPVLEGYGLTETAPVVAVNPPEAPKVGTVGPPVYDLEIRLDADATDLDPQDGGTVGELLVRGPNVTDGYWRDPATTAAAFVADDAGRWFRTGDVIERRPDDYLRFRGRVSNLLVLSTGETVAPVPLEDALTASEFLEQAMVLGDGRRFVTALLVPAERRLRAWADAEGVDLPSERAALCRDTRVRDRIAAELDRINERLEPHERIQEFRLVPEPFTRANGLLTPTSKKRRAAIRDRHADAVGALYDG